MAVDGRRADDEHPAWCSPAHCFVTEEGVRVHEQAPIRWEAQCVAPLRFETCLIDPGDDDTTYLELRVRDLKWRGEFHAILSLDTARRFRDQLTEHLDAALLSHRLGAANVYSVGVDSHLVDDGRDRPV